jgi:hypothetical protein
MKIRAFVLATMMLCVATMGRTQGTLDGAVNSAFAGIWDGEQMNGLPSLNIKIENAGGKLSGGMVFYLQKRKNTDGPWHVEGESPVPMLAPRVEGKTLLFEVEHHKCHDCTELGPNVKFREDLISASEARLWKLDENGSEAVTGAGLKLTRRK